MAHKDRLIEIQNLVVELDTPIDDVSSDFRVYPVRNVSADDLKTVLQDFLTKTQQSEQAARAGAPAGQGGAVAGGRRSSPPVVVSDKSSNSLLITASQSKWEELSVLINRLDKRQPQVLIETALIELATEDAARFGIELGLLDIGEGDFTTGFGFTSFGLSQFQDTDGNGLPDTRVPDFENPLRGVTGGILRSKDFAIPVIANALQSDRSANVLSIPSVLVNNNKNATVISQAEVATSTASQNVSGTQTGFAGFQPAGIELKISPSISSANYLRLNVDLKVSKFQGSSADPAIPPPRTTRQIVTEVTMPSGHTMVLGGVIEDSSSDASEGIPFLKDIPILGWLFKRWDNSHSKTNLYFFITPHILVEEDFSDLAEMTFRKKVEASEYIGHRRLQIVDRSWRGSDVLEDSGSTLEQIDKLGGFEIPAYQKPELHDPTSTRRQGRQGQQGPRRDPQEPPGPGTREGPNGPPGPAPDRSGGRPETRPGGEQR
jgi:general secretion pathway protein D